MNTIQLISPIIIIILSSNVIIKSLKNVTKTNENLTRLTKTKMKDNKSKEHFEYF